MTRRPFPFAFTFAIPFPLPRASRRLPLTALLLAGLMGCQQAGPAAAPAAQVTRDTPCSLDGMTLDDFPGPKAQVVYESGAPDFFCDTIELFAVAKRPGSARRVASMYVQDMARAAWDHPEGHWIDAKGAFYVVGSKARGSMGGTFASFAKEDDAKAFVAREGGKVYTFEQVTPDMAQLDGGVVKDKRM